LVWGDVKTYIRLERAVADSEASAYASWELRKGGEFARIGGNDNLDLRDESTWLRIERRGNTFYGSVSADGVQWTTMEPIAVDLPRKLQVGILAGQNTATGFTPCFENLKVFEVSGDR
jgi:hypothetical protein